MGQIKSDFYRWFTINYNFSNSATSAFGNNLKALGSGRYALYNGDINNDGIVNTLHVNSIGNDASGFMGAYLTSDLNGDGIVDALDLIQADNNAANFVSAHAPEILGPFLRRSFFADC